MRHTDLFHEFGCDGELIEVPDRCTDAATAHLSPKHRTEALEKLCATATKTVTEQSETKKPVAVSLQ